MSVDLGNWSHGRLTLTNVTLSECLRFAFKIHTDDQIVGPDWIRDHHTLFNIVAQAPPDTPLDTVRQMALALLTERFRLTLHRSSRELRYLALVVDAGGLKMQPTKEDAPLRGEIVRPGRIVYRRVSPLMLVVLLSRFTGEPIFDRTGIKEQFDVDLKWTPDTANPKSPSEASNPAAEPSLFAAVKEQLGLKLEGRKGPLDVVIVDHAERSPIEN
jgi:uncharacterized protein (TIGR03435 family)